MAKKKADCGEAALAVIVLVGQIKHGFKKGDRVIDLTARRNKWKDVRGIVRKTDGPLVLVRYTSGNERWKLCSNISKAPKK